MRLLILEKSQPVLTQEVNSAGWIKSIIKIGFVLILVTFTQAIQALLSLQSVSVYLLMICWAIILIPFLKILNYIENLLNKIVVNIEDLQTVQYRSESIWLTRVKGARRMHLLLTNDVQFYMTMGDFDNFKNFLELKAIKIQELK